VKPASSSADVAIGVDIGGSKTAVGIVDRSNGTILQSTLIPTPPRDRTGPAFLGEIAGTAMRMLAEHPGPQVGRLGIGICELVDHDGEIVSSHRVDITRQQVRDAFRDFGDVAVDSDIRAAASAEARFGHGRGRGPWIYVNAGTGIASVLMNGPECFLGAHGWVYSLGMSPVDLSLPEMAGVTLIEEVSGGSGLVTLARRRGLDVAAVHEVMAAAAAGSEDSVSVLATGGRVLGAAIALLVNTLDPEAVVIGGGVVVDESPYWNSLVAAVRQHIWHAPAKSLPVLRSALSNNAGLIGAALAQP
jgi:glucokinase